MDSNLRPHRPEAVRASQAELLPDSFACRRPLDVFSIRTVFADRAAAITAPQQILSREDYQSIFDGVVFAFH